MATGTGGQRYPKNRKHNKPDADLAEGAEGAQPPNTKANLLGVWALLYWVSSAHSFMVLGHNATNKIRQSPIA